VDEERTREIKDNTGFHPLDGVCDLVGLVESNPDFEDIFDSIFGGKRNPPIRGNRNRSSIGGERAIIGPTVHLYFKKPKKRLHTEAALYYNTTISEEPNERRHLKGTKFIL